MEKFPILNWPKNKWPKNLKEISDPPKKLFYRGQEITKEVCQNNKFVTIIGPRKYTDYGAEVCRFLIRGLIDQPIYIVSGLAFGIDSLAHQYAMEFGLKTIAFPGSGLHEKVLYPKAHFNLACEILENAGTIISEFSENLEAAPWTFPVRNRLMAGLAHLVIVIEAGEKSGTMITSRLALDYNRDVMAVPGSIFNSASIGTNQLIKEGAFPITNSQDILEVLGLQ